MSESFNKSIGYLRNRSWYDIIDGYITMVIKRNGSEHELWRKEDSQETLLNIKEDMKKIWDRTDAYDFSILRADGIRYAIFPRGG